MPDNQNLEKIIDIVEQIPTPEQSADVGKSIEQTPEQVANIEQTATPIEIVLPDNTPTATPQVSDSQIILQKVENILSNNMDKAFLSMDVTTQHKFKVKGEQTSHQITVLLQKGKATIRKISSLILEWLRIIPQVNKHYIEQEAKIKAENIINMYKNR